MMDSVVIGTAMTTVEDSAVIMVFTIMVFAIAIMTMMVATGVTDTEAADSEAMVDTTGVAVAMTAIREAMEVVVSTGAGDIAVTAAITEMEAITVVEDITITDVTRKKRRHVDRWSGREIAVSL
jgi:hypothetical protein